MNTMTTEQAILEAAERLFLEKGFTLTSTTDIAKAAGCNQALINYYFRSKEKLFTTIFEKKFLLFFTAIGGDLAIDLSFNEKIGLLVERHFDMLLKNPQLPTLLIQELSLHPDRVTELKDAVFDQLQGLLTQLAAELKAEIAAGRIRQVEIYDIIQTLVALNIGVFLTRQMFKEMLNRSDAEMDRAILQRGKENARILLASLKPEGAA